MERVDEESDSLEDLGSIAPCGLEPALGATLEEPSPAPVVSGGDRSPPWHEVNPTVGFCAVPAVSLADPEVPGPFPSLVEDGVLPSTEPSPGVPGVLSKRDDEDARVPEEQDGGSSNSESHTKAGYKRAGQGVRVLDVFGGIGTTLHALAEAGVAVQKYWLVEICPKKRRIAWEYAMKVHRRWPGLVPFKAISGMLDLPADVLLLSESKLAECGTCGPDGVCMALSRAKPSQPAW